MDQAVNGTGLDHWVGLLRDKLLPVKQQTVERLQQLFEQEDLSLRQLIPVIEADPVFTLHLMQLANQLNNNDDTEANSVELAVTTLGLEHIAQLTNKLPIIKLNPNSVAHRWYFHCLDISVHAAWQATDLSHHTGHKVLCDTRTAALFYSLGHWALWRYAPVQMSQIKIAMHEHQQDTSLAEYDVLGCTIQQISAALIEHWKLSHLAQEALSHDLSPDNQFLETLQQFNKDETALPDDQQKQSRRLLNSNFFPVKLANWLAQTTIDHWENPKALRVQQLISIFLNQPMDTVTSRLHQTCINASRAYYTAGILSPAALLLLCPSSQQLSYRLENTGEPSSQADARVNKLVPPSKPAAKKSQLPHHLIHDEFKSKEIFQQHCHQLLQPSEPFQQDKTIYALLEAGLLDGLGFSRVAIFKANQQTISSYMLSGFAVNDPMHRFQQRLHVPSLFSKLGKQPAAVHMHKANRHQLLAELPDRFKSCSNQHSFVLLSLFQDQQLSAFIYADHDQKAIDVSPFFFKYFKLICNAAHKRLQELTSQ